MFTVFPPKRSLQNSKLAPLDAVQKMPGEEAGEKLIWIKCVANFTGNGLDPAGFLPDLACRLLRSSEA
ncbi:hypothetical protein J057_24205 [Marinobacter nanhaiticus D15-8W]|uniref:Uncharacterized protein n=1 Tax=Marinobacter nanhaiticus D15-8W TaxID=626887 RepID=A0A371CGA9_9GAMM|nr:hypothetical protein J057_24205 [Marinobacter nanhaiticus D15-8W]